MKDNCYLMLGTFVVMSLAASGNLFAQPNHLNFKGVNWADERDNFVDDCINLSGIAPSKNESQTLADAEHILKQFKSLLGVNCIRLGINPPTVSDQEHWAKYRAIVRQSTQMGFKVVLACWESESERDGKIDDQQKFQEMWRKVLTDFGSDKKVYFEIFNEPYGYSDRRWREIAATWISENANRIHNSDKSRIIVGGSGYCEHLIEVGNDERFKECLLGFHLYSWFGNRNHSILDWKNDIARRIGKANANRTIVTEWGANLRNRPQDYYHFERPVAKSDQAFMKGMSGQIQEWRTGSIYWPGLRDRDPFSMLYRDRNSNELSVANRSGLELLQKSFGQVGKSKKDH